MKIVLVLYCAQTAEFACKEIDSPPILQQYMLIGFEKLLLRVEKIVWSETIQKTLVCCGVFIKVLNGPQEGARVVFPFGKMPKSFWPPEKNRDWSVQTADSRWDSILSPVYEILSVDGEDEDYTG